MDANAMASAPAAAVDPEALEKRLRSGASWFFWIAGLSLVNTVMAVTGSDQAFLLGLAVTQAADALATVWIQQGGPEAARWVAVGFDVVVVGLFVGAGLLAARKKGWAFVLGIVLYVLDAALCAVFEDWPTLGFHAFALIFLVMGYGALRKLRALEAPAAPAPAANPLVR
ncbi:MAG TPA: hypothetical protein VLS93_06560 [Anaeromyxobacteraceae bacterium]|nr:hypothetical protein [Anaeromyxobacteraceae bacterium]